MVEWSITAVLKTVELRGSGGSNPSLSANNLKLSAKRWAFFVQGRQELAPVRTCAEKAHRPSGRELQIVCKGPSGEEGGMWRTKCGKSRTHLGYGTDIWCAKQYTCGTRRVAFGTREGLLRYGIDTRCQKRPPGVRDAFSEAFCVKNRRSRYGRDIRYQKPPSTVRDAVH